MAINPRAARPPKSQAAELSLFATSTTLGPGPLGGKAPHFLPIPLTHPSTATSDPRESSNAAGAPTTT